MGKLNKFYKDNTLLNQEFVKDSSVTIAQLLEKTSKGLTVTAFQAGIDRLISLISYFDKFPAAQSGICRLKGYRLTGNSPLK